MAGTSSRRWRAAACAVFRGVSPAGGELQRFAIAVVAAQEADVYMIDEPSSYLDVRQRLKAARVGRLPVPRSTSLSSSSSASNFQHTRVSGRSTCMFKP